jgi:S1-C subfamily serine protease
MISGELVSLKKVPFSGSNMAQTRPLDAEEVEGQGAFSGSQNDIPPVQPEYPKPSVDERRSMAVSFVSEAVQKIGPSVLRIDTETQMLQQEGEGVPRSPGFVQQGQGSGLIFSEDGLILTNAHVVSIVVANQTVCA